jgi:hypothetical protein
MAVDSKGSDSLFWVFRCGVEPICGPHCESRPSGLSLKVFIEKCPVDTNDDYISIPANHERLQLETDYSGEAEFTFTLIFLNRLTNRVEPDDVVKEFLNKVENVRVTFHFRVDNKTKQ